MNPSGILLAGLIGAMLPLQALLNARFGQLTQGPLFAALVSFGVGTLALLAWWLLARPQPVAAATLLRIPWWAWTGGLIGAVYVAASTLLIPRMGAAPLICLVVFGQLAGSLLLDQYGVLHARQPVDAMRIAGMVLVAVGVLLVVRPWQAR